MPLTLVLGPANSAKAGEVLGAYARAAHRGALLVVPTAADARHYAREVAEQGAVLGSVVTFAGLAGELAHRAGYRASRLSLLGRERVLARVCAAVSLEVLGPSAASPGFPAALGRLVSELQRALVSPERFAGAMQSWARGDRRREPYARDVTALYRGYARELERIGRVDRDLYAWRALDALRAEPGLWGATPVFLYGFDDLDRLERDCVETLSRLAQADVTVSLSHEPGRAAFAARAEAVEELRPLAGRVLALPALDDHYEPGSRQALHHVERSLFEPGAGRVDPGDAVRLLEAGGARAEAELLAAEIAGLLRAGVPGHEIVIMSRSLATAPVIERVLEQYGVPVAIERQLPFAHSALGRGLLALCRCAWQRAAPVSELLAYLRCPGVLRQAERADALERDVRRAGIGGAGQARELLGFGLQEIDSLREAHDLLQELARQARRMLTAMARGQGRTLEPAEELDARGLSALLLALAELDELGERPTPEELIELIETLQIPAPASVRPGAVLVADPLGVRARRFRVVFVCGLQEGAFPLPGVPEPFLSDERRRELAASSGLRLRLGEDALARERYLFYACISRATEQLILSYRSSDEEGNIELRSPFLADVEELLVEGWTARRRSRLLADVVWPADAAPTAHELARSRASAGAAVAGEPDAAPLRIGELALRRVRHRELVSAGALENYSDCPVKWLVERELSPERFEPELDAMARGSYMHDLLEQLFRELGGPVTPESLPRARDILADLTAELPAALAPGGPEPVRLAARAAIQADLRRYLEHEAADGCGWVPQQLELRFGFAPEDVQDDEPGSLPPVTLEDGPERVQLRGVIDRIDVDPDGTGQAIVWDYKSGARRQERSAARWRSDRQLQVALYMIAVRRLLHLEPVAGLYQPLAAADLRASGAFLRGEPVGARLYANDGRAQEELDELLRDAEQRAVALAVQLRSGGLTPCPQTCSRRGCSYPGICRSQ